ncbi:hypothetical protein Pmani_019941 [Petrolisthes manimaculis]|uniref:Uncharacterized protein n=1 Tax=Petrolisthes manimaculis TaxID=1843537 RepID=A0AAE1PH79_9EUCA|nr:hypothetical protein Pmani_019941 [Petrolisthes manimaculis]
MEEWDKTQRVKWRSYWTRDIVKDQDARASGGREAEQRQQQVSTNCVYGAKCQHATPPPPPPPPLVESDLHMSCLTSSLTTHQSRCIRICQLVLNNRIFL